MNSLEYGQRMDVLDKQLAGRMEQIEREGEIYGDNIKLRTEAQLSTDKKGSN